jgi:hypothetical protein
MNRQLMAVVLCKNRMWIVRLTNSGLLYLGFA